MVRLVFIHPDLGIGGAERAVVDAAMALKSRGHSVIMMTSHFDTKHCFEETRDGSLEVIAAGDWLPRTIFGYFYLVCAIIRILYLSLYLMFFSGIKYDVIYCDQLSACIPLLKLRKSTKVLFYCHFPDLLLSKRTNRLKKLYRKPLDWIEETTTGQADVVLVNSHFTANIFRETFKSLIHIPLQVLHPVPDFSNSAYQPREESSKKVTFLSINRYEIKKNIILAVKALNELKKLQNGQLENVELVVAGGYDDRVSENYKCYRQLVNLVESLNLKEHVKFHKSISSPMKLDLIKSSTCLLYTPSNEHFGIVPLEAMHYGLPVIAVNNGGPKETVVDGETGYLVPEEATLFAKKMLLFVKDPSLKGKLGTAGHKRVIEKFSFSYFTEKIDLIITNLVKS